ncbi:MAG: lysine transporter LysE [Dehalococcoidia bacterium]|nr:MAG: lysine transporter LysE [Dehalococcoidia bacterium]
MPEATLLIIFSTSFVVALSGALMPGPLLALTIAQAARRGFWAGPLLILGHGVLEIAILAVLVLGLRQLSGEGMLPAVIGIAGGIVLIVMGFGILARARRRMTLPTADPPENRRRRQGVVIGVLGSAANPYFFIWWVTIGASYLLWALKLGGWGIASFYTGHILADLGWYALVAFVVATGRKVISDAVYRWVFIFCGLALVGLGGYFIFSGGGYFIG